MDPKPLTLADVIDVPAHLDAIRALALSGDYAAATAAEAQLFADAHRALASVEDPVAFARSALQSLSIPFKRI
jgi:hypothetical protein